MKDSIFHKPVMVYEVIRFLNLKHGYKILDATVGTGGHAYFILEKIQPDGFLIGIDCDSKMLTIAESRLNKFKGRYKLIKANFKDFDKVLSNLGLDGVDAALFDLGISSDQLMDADRGFSFESEGPLDMRIDRSGNQRAYDIVNRYNRKELEGIISEFGQEWYFRKIVEFILERRKSNPINSTRELSDLIKKAVGGRYRYQKIHPATRTFQALRIAVNSELDNIDNALGKILNFLRPSARLCVISFHSLEDRIVKLRFKESEKAKEGYIITKKPLRPSTGEIKTNPRSRSAKLRVFEKHG